VKNSYNDLLEHSKDISNQQKEELSNVNKALKNESSKSIETIVNINHEIRNNNKYIAEEIQKDIKQVIDTTKSDFETLTNSLSKNQKELDMVSSHFKSLGEQIPTALKISLEELNKGLTSLTSRFQTDYSNILDDYKKGIK
ncbi:MAG: hypothetical protein U9Q30_10395, partial [Campylobacterota bacterium]|nr:hypothetical protein [Campylobacterota bacterium]